MNTVLVILLVLVLVAACVFMFLRWSKRIEHAQGRRVGSKPENERPEQSLKDKITELYNRSHLLRRLQEVMGRCDRTKEQLALVLWDIDGFVDFNNQYGKKQGDIFLRRVADTIRESLRSYDEAFRSGPDEFCAILIPADKDVANGVQTRVNQVVSEKLFEGQPQYADKEFSISSGVVYYPSVHQMPEALLYAAREHLYQTKAVH